MILVAHLLCLRWKGNCWKLKKKVAPPPPHLRQSAREELLLTMRWQMNRKLHSAKLGLATLVATLCLFGALPGNLAADQTPYPCGKKPAAPSVAFDDQNTRQTNCSEGQEQWQCDLSWTQVPNGSTCGGESGTNEMGEKDTQCQNWAGGGCGDDPFECIGAIPMGPPLPCTIDACETPCE